MKPLTPNDSSDITPLICNYYLILAAPNHLYFGWLHPITSNATKPHQKLTSFKAFDSKPFDFTPQTLKAFNTKALSTTLL